MTNAFNFDVSEIMLEVKQARDKRLIAEKYQYMDFKVLKEIIHRTQDMDPEEIKLMHQVYEERVLQNLKDSRNNRAKSQLNKKLKEYDPKDLTLTESQATGFTKANIFAS